MYGRLMSRDELFHIKAFSLAGGDPRAPPAARVRDDRAGRGSKPSKLCHRLVPGRRLPPGTFQQQPRSEVDAEQAEAIRGMLVSTMRRREPLVYGSDAPPGAVRRRDADERHSCLGVRAAPGPGGRHPVRGLTYANVEQSTLQVIEALRPWLVRAETALSR